MLFLKRYLSLLALIAIHFNAKPQSYSALLEQPIEWHVTSCTGGCITDVYQAADDTTVNGITYRILDGYHFISRTFWLRENKEEKRIYFTSVNGSKNEEYLLYDFSLEIGDTINVFNPLSPFPENPGNFILDSIVTKPWNQNEELRYFYLTALDSNLASSPGALWIEGIGSLALVNTPGALPDSNGVGELSCVFKQGVISYQSNLFTDDCTPVITSGHFAETNKSSVSISIKNERLFLESDVPFQNVKIYSLTGSLVSEASFQSTISKYVSLSSAQRGVYLIRVEGINGSSWVSKIFR